jgi:hypothetical protein
MPDEFASVEINANRSSLLEVVENEGDVMLVLEVERSVDLVWSTVIALHAGVVTKNKSSAQTCVLISLRRRCNIVSPSSISLH